MKKPLINEDGEVRELTAEDMRKFRPAPEVLPPELYAILTKCGAGWQSRINEALRKSVAKSRRRSA
jgi:hypothetical protein